MNAVATSRDHAAALKPESVPPTNSFEPLLVELLNTENAFDQLKGFWQALEKVDPECKPFNTWDWQSLWWTHYRKESDTLAILVARQGRQVIAIAPFYVGYAPELRLMKIRLLRFIGTGGDTSPDYMNIIALPQLRVAAEIAMINYLPNIPGWSKLLLRDVLKDSSLSLCIQAFVHSRPGFAGPVTQNMILTASLPESWEAYRAQLNRKRRKQINHRRNRLNDAGEWQLSICASADELQEAMEALKELHRLRWESRSKQGRFASESYVRFHEAAIRRFFAQHCLWLTTLRLNKRIIGVQYIYLCRGELQFYQSGYSPEHDNLSCGHVLFTYAIQRGIEQGVRSINMLKGNYKYKSAYAKTEFYTTDHVFVKRGFYSFLARGKSGVRALLSAIAKI